MSVWTRVLLAATAGSFLTFGVSTLLEGTLSFWATVAISYVCGVALTVAVLAISAPRRSWRTKHRDG